MKTTSTIIGPLCLFIFFASDLISPDAAIAQPYPKLAQCCTNYPYQLTIAARGLLKSFDKVITKSGTSNCAGKYNVASYTSAMPTEYIGSAKLPGIVTYAVHNWTDSPASTDEKEGGDLLRAIWDSNPDFFPYYGACTPKPIIYPASDVLKPNDLFGAMLIPVRRYQAYQGNNKGSWPMLSQGLMISQVSAILNVYIEEKGGYMDNNEHGAYNDKYSSKGVIVVVQMKNKSVMPCYITNSYDSGWLIWKEPNYCAGL